jgi:CRISPR/Cas system-associated exonuclease Cas4 (RecB family)
VGTDFAKIIGQAFRDKEKLITGVTQHLIRDVDQGRRTGYLHPSALSSEAFCPRAAYYDITGAVADPTPRNLAFEMVFERGHDSHEKWQTWFWEMGNLRGMFKCMLCYLYWEDRSPWSCPRCEAGIDLLEYAEVPVFNEEYQIRGQADGDVWHNDHWTLIEIKTIGIGTLRWDAPQMLERHSFNFTDDHGNQVRGLDLDNLWSDIRRPFPPHIRQGMIYCFCAGRTEIIYLYEPKFATAFPKEFDIKFRMDLIEDQLANCIKVKDHLEMQRPPKRPGWAEKKCKTCKQCPFKSTCYSLGK